MKKLFFLLFIILGLTSDNVLAVNRCATGSFFHNPNSHTAKKSCPGICKKYNEKWTGMWACDIACAGSNCNENCNGSDCQLCGGGGCVCGCQ